MAGPYQNFPLTQREFHEQAAVIAYQPPPPEPQRFAGVLANPFVPNPYLVRDE